MGVYIFKRDVLQRYLKEDAVDSTSKHDFGFSIIPKMVAEKQKVYAYPFSDNVAPGQRVAFWRDVGTVDAYWQEHMNLLSDDPLFNMFAEQWRLVTGHDGTAGFKCARRVVNDHSMGCGSTIVDLSELRYTMLGRRIHIHARCSLEESIIFDQVHIEEDCHLKKTIIDVDPWLTEKQRVVIPRGTTIGLSRKEDEARGFSVTDSGITVVPYTWFEDKTITVE